MLNIKFFTRAQKDSGLAINPKLINILKDRASNDYFDSVELSLEGRTLSSAVANESYLSLKKLAFLLEKKRMLIELDSQDREVIMQELSKIHPHFPISKSNLIKRQKFGLKMTPNDEPPRKLSFPLYWIDKATSTADSNCS